jgi:hypothetical protein
MSDMPECVMCWSNIVTVLVVLLAAPSLSLLSPMSSPFLFLAFLFPIALAQVATPRFGDCFSGNTSLKLNVSTIYAQITTSQSFGTLLNITVLGQSPQPIQGTANGSSDLGASSPSPFSVSFDSSRRNLSHIVLEHGDPNIQRL